MKRLALLVVAIFTAVSAMSAATACPVPTEGNTVFMSDLIGYGSVGCQSEDKIFSNFSYTVPGVGIAATDLKASLVLTRGTSSDIHGWLFAPLVGSWTNPSSGFTIGYTITVAPSAPPSTWVIYASKDQINTGLVPNGVTMRDVQSIGNINTFGILGTESAQLTYAGVNSVTTRSTATIPLGDELMSYEQDFFQRDSAVPEPVTMVLIGSGLLGLGFIRRRAKKS